MNTSEPTTGEIVRALRRNANKEKNMFDGGFEEKPSLSDIAADRLESQDKQIAELSSNCDCIMEAFMSICTVAFKMSAKSAEKDTIIAELAARAESAERERDAAVADMKLIVDAVREEHCDETCCFACKFDCDTSINDSGEYGSECPGFDRDDCFEWRGLPQEGEWK